MTPLASTSPRSAQAIADLRTIADQLRGGETVALLGPPGPDRVLALTRLGDQLSNCRAVRVQMPARGDDAGLVVLAMLAAESGNQGALDSIKDPHTPWSTKVDDTLRAISAAGTSAGQRSVVLVDGVRLSSEDAPRQMFDERTAELIAKLASSRDVSMAFTTSSRPAFAAHEWQVAEVVEPRTSAPEFVEAIDEPPGGPPDFQRYSQLELRLAASLRRLGMAPEVISNLAGPRKLAMAWLTRLPRHAQLALARLAVLRMPCDRDTRDEIVQIRDSDARWLQEGLEETEEGFLLPELLAEELANLQAQRRFAADRIRLDLAHKRAAKFHQEQFDFAANRQDVVASVRHELEVVYHLTQAGDATGLFARSLWFVEQYDALGKCVGTRGAARYRQDRSNAPRRPRPPTTAVTALLRDAIKAYERALAHDPRDAYALHYQAYNLDILGEDAIKVEEGYRAAVSVSPDNVWHHSRLITFLVTRGRQREAHVCWVDALRTLDDARGHRWLYEELHRSLALLLLHRGALRFAQEVLDDVNEHDRDYHWFPALRLRLRGLLDAEADQLVFPPWIPENERWRQPRLVWGQEQVSRWRPGRIESIDDDHVSIRYAVSEGAGNVSFGRTRLTAAELKRRCSVAAPPPGTFVELICLDGRREELIRCYPEVSSEMPALPPPFPPPDRYLNRAATLSRG